MVTSSQFRSARSAVHGFTLIEVMITVGIIGILASVAIPSYNEYATRGRITDAVGPLADMRVKMEQYFQDHRTYVGACSAGTVAPLPAATSNFGFSCNGLSATAYTVIATGQNSMTGFVYKLDQLNARKTTGVKSGWSGVNSNCWVLRKDGSC